ncbi:hypothetical protein [Mesorhizobium sp. B2-4-6]|uniref:hypothetical protein n=1 Tax=Mesorhizobium sp. B2-4-6 TaxID=2589943 RepID=UPI001128E19E|nr:hypothetical protein [Mesorhizobium sp. B2-4-6]TPL36003.1 hypothetical protein FJ957_29820 [Mesorhizobium sp. B2-4-6]
MDPSNQGVKPKLDGLITEFFRAVSFETGGVPPYETIRDLFIERALLIKNVGTTPEISSVDEFIRPREALVRSGTLARFHEAEVSESTLIFGNVAHRFSAYTKSGTSSGIAFEARGMITTQFINTPAGWKMSAMA